MLLHNTTYCGMVPMFSYIDSLIIAPHHSRDQRCVIPLALASYKKLVSQLFIGKIPTSFKINNL